VKPLAFLIDFSLTHRRWVLAAAALLTAWGGWAVSQNATDAIPDLSENQVIVLTEWQGGAPRLVDDQITYPLSTALQGLAGVKEVRGQSMPGMSFVYVVFEDDYDIYDARMRVGERLSEVAGRLPAGTRPTLGPDGTAVGHILWYTLRSSKKNPINPGELRALQDFYLKPGLQSTKGVAEVASLGGFVPQFQVFPNLARLAQLDLTVLDLARALRTAGGAVGGGRLENGGQALNVIAEAYLASPEDIAAVAVTIRQGVPITIGELAEVRLGAEPRLGMAEENGQGEAVAGVVVMRYGENPARVAKAVRERLEALEKGLPKGATLHIAYDRTELIDAAVASIRNTLLEEALATALVVLLFLFHARSALVILLQLPISVAISFLLLHSLGISSNIMSLTGIALAIGVIVDDSIVMVENAYRRLAEESSTVLKTISAAARQVAPGVVGSTFVVILSFLPVFLLEGTEGKLFGPLAYTKTFILLVDAFLAVTLTPVLIYYFLGKRGKRKTNAQLNRNRQNFLNRWLEALYRPALAFALRFRPWVLMLSLWAVVGAGVLLAGTGTEFMPPLDEGDILYMPVASPDIAPSEARRLLQWQDKVLAATPEVAYVLGKAGRASTATDNAPLAMMETIVRLKPRSEWRPSLEGSKEKLIAELNMRLAMPGVTNGFTQPVINRINMLTTGIRTDVGVKLFGDNLNTLSRLAERVRLRLKGVEGVADLFTETAQGGRYLEIHPDRAALARYGIPMADVLEAVSVAIGGETLSGAFGAQSVVGRRRYGIALRLPPDARAPSEILDNISLLSFKGERVPLSVLCKVEMTPGPAMVQSEGGRLRTTVMFNVRGGRGADLGSTVARAKARLAPLEEALPAGYTLEYAGQFAQQQRAQTRLLLIIPLVLILIGGVLMLTYKNLKESIATLVTVPVALAGGVYAIAAFGANLSVAVAVGFIALFGVAMETAMLMTVYLHEAMAEMVAAHGNSRETLTPAILRKYVMQGAVQRLRPKLMTVAVSLFGLFPALWATGTGSDVIRPITLPLIGGLASSSLYVLFVTPLVFEWLRSRELKRKGRITVLPLSE